MTLRVVFRRAAQAEFEEAAAWYGERGLGLSVEFVREIDQAIASAAGAPQRCLVVFGDIRRIVARRFPFAVYFRVAPRQWWFSPFFTVAEIRPSGSVGYNRAVENDASRAALARAFHRER